MRNIERMKDRGMPKQLEDVMRLRNTGRMTGGDAKATRRHHNNEEYREDERDAKITRRRHERKEYGEDDIKTEAQRL